MVGSGPDRTAAPSVKPAPRARHYAALLILLAAAIWAWSGGLPGPYQFDDVVTPLDDPASQSLSAWSQHFATTLRPLTKLSYALEAEAGIVDVPAVRRAASLLVHAASAVLLFLLSLRLAPAIGPLSAAALAAIWFAHPVHADSLLLLSGRTTALANALLFGALLALDRSRSWLAAALLALACLARETALAALLPCVAIAASRSGARPRQLLRDLFPPIAAGLLALIWLASTPRYVQLADYWLLGLPFRSSICAQIGAVPVGLGLLVNPAGLSIDYGLPLPARPVEPLFVLGLLMYAAAAVGVMFSLQRSRAIAVGLALWLAALLPTQSVIPKLDPLTNRPLSLALAGLLIVAAALLAAGLSRLDRSLAEEAVTTRAPRPSRWPWLAVGGCAVALIAMLTINTASRAQLFRSELTLWEDAAAKSLTNERPHLQYAALLMRAGRVPEAREAVSIAAQINPLSSEVAMFSRAYRSVEETQ